MYRCASHSISVSKFWGGGCRELVKCGMLLWMKRFHNHCSRSVLRVIMYFPCWSYIWASFACICIVGWSELMSLSGLLSCMVRVRLVIFRGGCMNLVSFGWV